MGFINSYMLINGFAFVVAVFWAEHRLNRLPQPDGKYAHTIAVVAVVFGWGFAHFTDMVSRELALYTAGFVFLGGLISGVCFYILVGSFFLNRANLVKSIQSLVPVLVLSHGIGRIGCYSAGCCFGEISGFSGNHYPVQLVEASFLIIFSLFLITRGMRTRVQPATLYLMLYPIFRFGIEFWRGDDRPFWGELSFSQCVSLPLLAIGLLLLMNDLKLKKYKPVYINVFSKFNLTLVVLTFATTALAQNVPFTPGFTGRLECLPVDEGKDDPELVAFRESCLKAAMNADIDFLVENADDDLGFGYRYENPEDEPPPGTGKAQLRELLSDPNHRDYAYDILINHIPLGGKWGTEWLGDCKNSRSCFECDATKSPEDYGKKYQLYGRNLSRVIGENVNVRTEADSKSAVVAQVSNEFVELLSPSDESSGIRETINGEMHIWCQVKTADGKVGYIFSKFIYPRSLTPDMGLVVFRKIDGRWKLAYLHMTC